VRSALVRERLVGTAQARRSAIAFWGGFLVLLVVLPIVYSGDSYVLAELVLFAIYLGTNLMWGLVIGTAGLYSFATVAITGVGTYAGVWLSVKHGVSWPVELVVGVAAAAVLGLLLALPAVRLRGVYFALFTIGLVEAFQQWVTADTQNLGGAQGLYGAKTVIPSTLEGLPDAYTKHAYPLAAGVVVVALVAYWWISEGRLGLRLRTARESEPFAQALGIDVPRARLAVFVATSAVLGLVGAYKGVYTGSADPSSEFNFDTLLFLFAMIVVGGVNSPRGILIGSAILFFIEEHWVGWGANRFILLGALMLVVTLLATNGLVGLPTEARRLLRRRRGEVPEPTEGGGEIGAEVESTTA
jgi:branched-chain amino acid transport system permease protein